MSLFITQCPHCHTSFKTSVSQLQSADGMVRCGACLCIFAADDNLLPSVDIRTISLPAHDENARLEDEHDNNEDQLPLADLTATEDEDEIKDTENIFTLDIADSLPNRVSPIISESDTSWQILDENPEPQDLNIEPPLSPNPNSEVQAEPAEPNERAELVIEDDELHLEKSDDEALARARLNTPEFTNEILDEVHHSNSINTLHVDFDEDPLELNSEETPRKTLGITLMSFVLLTCLALQTVWANRDALAQNPQWRPALETLCAPINCGLQPLTDLSQIRSDQLAIQSHPEFSNALRVKAQFRNDAAFAQALPGLMLKFTNTNGELVAQRRFTPEQYLDAELKELAIMPAKSQLQVTLDLLDPGPQALNYEISFYAISAN